MELRVLKYFIAVAKQKSITKASEMLFMTQPTLSRQIKGLEKELGVELFVRSKKNHDLSLTEDGMFLLTRAEEIVALADKTSADFEWCKELLSGEVFIGGGETQGMRLVANTIMKIQNDYPLVKFSLFSGNSNDVTEKLDKGLLDFGVVIEPCDINKYNYIKLPITDVWGAIVKKDSILAQKQTVKHTDLVNLPLILSKQTLVNNQLLGWTTGNDDFNIVANYNLIYNASLLVEAGVGVAVAIDGLINNDKLCFIPLEPKLTASLSLIWKNNQPLSKASKLFLEYIKSELISN